MGGAFCRPLAPCGPAASGAGSPVCRPYGVSRSHPFFIVGAGPRPARRILERREGHTPGWLLSAFGRFTFSPSPTGFKKVFRNWVGEPLGAPARICTSSHLLNQARRRTGTALVSIWGIPGPSGPDWTAESHSDFARRKFSTDLQVRVPRNGGPGVSRHWRTKFASAASPGDPLGTFPSLGKYLAPQGETLLQQTKGLYHCPLIRPLRGHLPPEGKALER